MYLLVLVIVLANVLYYVMDRSPGALIDLELTSQVDDDLDDQSI